MDLIERELKWGGKTETVYFRPLTAGQQYELAKGQVIKTRDGQMEFDAGMQLDKNYRLIQQTLVTEDDKRVFKNMQEVHDQPAKRITALIKLAGEVNKEDDEGNA